ncbi:MAG: C39 family peptidase [Desulfopila sp.]
MTTKTIIIASIAAWLMFAGTSRAGTVMIPGASGINIAVKITSQEEARYQTILKQQYDFSCGSAALASLLTFHYADPVSEDEVFTSMYAAGDKMKIRQNGFSLLDMKNYLRRRGYAADGFKTSLDKLQEVGIPAIVLITQRNYAHFVIIKGVTPTEVLLGDPSSGIRRLTRTTFDSIWGGLLFIIRNKAHIAKHHFNDINEWQINPPAPTYVVLRQLRDSNIGLTLRGINEF